jgi:hypothetical protein
MNLENRYSTNPHFVTSSVIVKEKPIEIHNCRADVVTSQSKLLIASTSPFKRDIDVSWLAAASESYQISPDIKDYIVVDVPIVSVDVPNRNLQSFDFSEVSYYDPLYGMPVYQTFKGKPSCADHQNKDPYKAKGVILDATMQYVPQYKVWKIRILQAFDRTKDTTLTGQILSGERRGYSMGALVSNFVCSVCGAIETQHAPCSHFKTGKGSIYNGRLVYQVCCGVVYIECSSVSEPADNSAESDVVWE